MLKLRVKIPGRALVCASYAETDGEEANLVLRGFSGTPRKFVMAGLLSEGEFWEDFAKQKFESKKEFSTSEYSAMVEKAISSIGAQQLGKVVLSRSSFHGSTSISAEQTFNALLEAYEDCTVFALSHPELGDWMGATPEILLEQTSDGYRSMSLAGTRLKGGSTWGDKEKEEQKFVTKEIHKTLNDFEGKVKRSTTETLSAGPVEHLLTWVSLTESKDAPSEILESLHPTPAVCGTPTDKAALLISELEPHDRELYTGYLAFMDEKVHASVLLRTMKWHNNGVQFFAGGGITKDSVPLNEWMETEYKISALKDLLC